MAAAVVCACARGPGSRQAGFPCACRHSRVAAADARLDGKHPWRCFRFGSMKACFGPGAQCHGRSTGIAAPPGRPAAAHSCSEPSAKRMAARQCVMAASRHKRWSCLHAVATWDSRDSGLASATVGAQRCADHECSIAPLQSLLHCQAPSTERRGSMAVPKRCFQGMRCSARLPYARAAAASHPSRSVANVQQCVSTRLVQI